MPIAPEFIPLTKKHEMFAITSWRDSPGHKPSAPPAQAGNFLDSLRNKPAGSPALGATAAAPACPVSPPSVVPVESPAVDKSGEAGRRRSHRHRKSTAGAPAGGVPVVEVEDYVVHVLLPNGGPKPTLIFEVQTDMSPLRVVDIGQARSVGQRRPTDAAAETEPAKAIAARPAAAAAAAVATDGPQNPQKPPPFALSPFRTPAVHGRTDTDHEHGLPPAMELPPPEMTAATTATAATAGGAAQGAKAGAGAPVVSTAVVLSDDYQVSFLFAEESEANKTVALVEKRWPAAKVTMVSRSRGTLNASLVLKGLPGLGKTELLLEELNLLPNKPSYVRLHRGDRGVFKNVVFVKYATREAAEDSKLRLERYHLGNRPLKVEFKKKAAKVAEAEAEDSTAPGSLQQLVRDLRVSNENEGFTYQRSDLTKDELKMLKQLCQSYNLYFDITETKVTVRRALGRHRPGMPTSGSPSPAMRPQSTPAWVMATPAGLVPKDFKGLRHWRDVRSQQQEAQGQQLAIVRPLGPDDGKAAFLAGRGRPL